jgi:hypothetical protein
MGAGIRLVRGTLTATAAAYSTGQAVGVTASIANAFSQPLGNGFIRSVSVYDSASQAVAFELLSAGSREGFVSTDKAVFAPTAAAFTLGRAQAVIPFATTDIFAYSGLAFSFKAGLYIPVRGFANTTTSALNDSDVQGKSLAVAMVTRGTPTYGAISLTIQLGISDE